MPDQLIVIQPDDIVRDSRADINYNFDLLYRGLSALSATNVSGYSGTSGYSGLGLSGYSGAEGPQGVQGSNGTQGIDGAQGAQGVQGFNGTQGIDGAQGAQGVQGFNGTQGIDGAQGAQGVQGFNGTQGIDGAQGSQGNQGNTGYSGYQGPSGPQGPDGASGYSGAPSLGIVYYTTNTLTSDPLHFLLSTLPDPDPQNAFTTTLSGFGSPSSLRFVSLTGTPGLVDLPAGTWEFQLYADVSQVSANAYIIGEIYKHAGDDTHTFLASGYSDIITTPYVPPVSTANPGYYLFQVTTSATSFDVTDRIEIRLGAVGETGNVLNLYIGGNHQSKIVSGIFRGAAGAQGAQGIFGAQGNQGNQGNQGVLGNSGYQGFQGTSGYQGNQGASGTSGYQGLPGPGADQSLNTYNDVTFNTVQVGSTTTAGVLSAGTSITLTVSATTGSIYLNPGSSGSVVTPTLSTTGGIYAGGTLGTSGYVLQSTGTGVAWVAGGTGAQGNQGNQGAAGATGAQGASGYQGFQGNQGFQGQSGWSGYQGYQGVSGYQGYQGVSGYQGFQGNQGFQGQSGWSGYQGYQGVAGAQGVSGYSGISGYQGNTGNQGVSGYSGTLTSTITFTEGTNIPSAASIDDYAISAGAFFKITGTTASTVTGFAGGSAGRYIVLVNNTNKNQTFANEDTTSLASNRFSLGVANKTIGVNSSITFIYVTGLTVGGAGSQSRWVLSAST